MIFYILLTIFVLAPLPFGGALFCGISLIVAALFLSSTYWICRWNVGVAKAGPAWRHGKVAFYLLLLTSLWIGFQAIPLPSKTLALFSPYAAQQYDDFSHAASAPLSLDAGSTWTAFVLTAGYLTLFGLLLAVIDTQAKVKALLWTIVISGMFQALYGTIMVLTGWEYGFFMEKTAYRGMATGTFINRNHLAGYLEMAVAAGVGLMLTEPRAALTGDRNWLSRGLRLADLILSWKACLRVGLVIMVVGLVMTRSRMGNAAFFLSLVLTGFFTFLGRPKQRQTGSRSISKTSVAVLFLSIAVVDVFVVSNWFGLERLAARLEQTTVEHEERVEINRFLWPMFKTFWPTGCGAGTFYSAFPAFVTEDGNVSKSLYEHAHNDLAQFAIELGVVGYVPLVLGVVASLTVAVRTLIQSTSPVARSCAVASFMGLSSLLVHSAVDFNLQIPANALLFVALMSLPWIGSGMGRKAETKWSS